MSNAVFAANALPCPRSAHKRGQERMFQDQIAEAVASARRLDQLDQIARHLWAGFASGVLDDAAAAGLSAAVEARRRAIRGEVGISSVQPPAALHGAPVRFPARRV